MRTKPCLTSDDAHNQNECVGAIGVSGVQSQDDEKVANAGVAALS